MKAWFSDKIERRSNYSKFEPKYVMPKTNMSIVDIFFEHF